MMFGTKLKMLHFGPEVLNLSRITVKMVCKRLGLQFVLQVFDTKWHCFLSFKNMQIWSNLFTTFSFITRTQVLELGPRDLEPRCILNLVASWSSLHLDPRCILILVASWSLLYPGCILVASSLHPLCILFESSLHPRWILVASSLHPRCILSASSLNPRCILAASSLHPHRILVASSLRPRCILVVSSLHPRCILVDVLMMHRWGTDDALMMHWWCTDEPSDALVSYMIFLNPLLFKNIAQDGSFKHLIFCLCLCLCLQVDSGFDEPKIISPFMH